MIAFAVLAVLIVDVLFAIRQWRVPQFPVAPSPQAENDSLGDTIAEALRQIPAAIDSAELKSRWTDEVKGVDVSALSPQRREIFLRFANAERCTCGCGFTLAGCRAYDATCEVSLPLARALLDSVRSGRIASAAGVRARP